MRKLANNTKWMLALSGVLMIILGIIVFSHPFKGVWSVAQLVGWLMLVAGVVDFVAFIVDIKRFFAGWLLIRGLVTAALGAFLAFRPIASLDVLTTMMGLWIIITGSVQFANSFVIKAVGQKEWYWFLIGGIIEAAAGVIVILHPVFSLLVAVYFMAAGLIVDGVINLIDAFRIQKALNEAKRWEKAVKEALAEVED